MGLYFGVGCFCREEAARSPARFPKMCRREAPMWMGEEAGVWKGQDPCVALLEWDRSRNAAFWNAEFRPPPPPWKRGKLCRFLPSFPRIHTCAPAGNARWIFANSDAFDRGRALRCRCRVSRICVSGLEAEAFRSCCFWCPRSGFTTNGATVLRRRYTSRQRKRQKRSEC